MQQKLCRCDSDHSDPHWSAEYCEFNPHAGQHFLRSSNCCSKSGCTLYSPSSQPLTVPCWTWPLFRKKVLFSYYTTLAFFSTVVLGCSLTRFSTWKGPQGWIIIEEVISGLMFFYSQTEAGSTAQRYPVMVYIHGGQFTSGASNQFPGHMLAAFYNVIVVSFNYRLGALGKFIHIYLSLYP